MLAEPTAQPDRDREEVVERVFEGRGPPALFLARDAVLSSFATGRATAMVVDAGHDSTTGELLVLFSCLRERFFCRGGPAILPALLWP